MKYEKLCLLPNPKKKTLVKCLQYVFWKKGLEFLNIACILGDPEKSLSATPVKFSCRC